MTLQQEIIQKLHVQPSISPREEIRKTIDFMKDYVKKQWDKGVKIESFVLGISGGQDSTLLGKLAQIAADELKTELGIPFYFIALRLPYGVQADETDALDSLTFIQPDKQFTVQIETAVNASYNAFTSATGENLSDFLKGNIKARERMKVQYDFAGHFRGLVLGTDHAAEAVTGFFTKWGDGACDLAPLFRLTKSQGRQMLIELGCPSHLYDKVPTADLEENKPLNPDETALGVTYHEIDDYLIGKEINNDSKEQIESHYLKTEHKRQGVVTLFDTWWKV